MTGTETTKAAGQEQEFEMACSTCCELADRLSACLCESRTYSLQSPEYMQSLRKICAVLIKVERHKAHHMHQRVKAASCSS